MAVDDANEHVISVWDIGRDKPHRVTETKVGFPKLSNFFLANVLCNIFRLEGNRNSTIYPDLTNKIKKQSDISHKKKCKHGYNTY